MHTTTESPSRIARVTEASFDDIVSSAPQVLVKFTAAWCPPCHALSPTLEAIAATRAGLVVVEVDADEEQGLGARFGVRGLPTLVVFRDGRPTGQLVGNQPRAKIEALLGG